ncbi:Delta2-dienoyl-CoA-isomerase [Mycena latifolia]|nr:Delta2-dienoyl-CoA-isomerase [Mycena latifolia]
MSLAADLSSKWLAVSEPIPHVLHIELSRKPVNAFSVELWRAYGALFDRIVSEGRDVRATIFTADIDLVDAAKMNKGGLTEGLGADGARTSLPMLRNRRPFPVIVAVHGPVFGLGADIISACDVRYAAEDAQFSIMTNPEYSPIHIADIGTLAHLPKITGNHSLMRELAYTARPFPAADAARLGLLSHVIPGSRDEVVSAALELAGTIAAKSPVAISGTKRVLLHARDHSIPENLKYTAIWNAAALHTDDITEALAASKARRTPHAALPAAPPAHEAVA